jgi:HD-GYP domain-containing protein (c-di-GMP phosphodiesterase class II)/DNA-binding CsgD family transcriptional regulator
MSSTQRPPLRVAELAAALSLATDLGTGQPLEHGLRVCLLATALAHELGASEEECHEVYYVALLRAIGCVSEAHRVADRFGNEMAANAHISLLDTAQPLDVMSLLLHHVGEGQPFLRRSRMILAALAAGPGERNQILAADCEVAQMLTQRLGMRPTISRAVAHVYERWDGKGSPHQLRGEAIMRTARIVIVARDAELFFRLGGRDGAAQILRQRSGTLYDPEITQRLLERAAIVFAATDADSAWDAVLASEPGAHQLLSDASQEAATRAVADFVDLKSSYLAGHSSGVAALAASAAESLGLANDEIALVRQAGYLHDLGRVATSTAIWDKPGPLTTSEREQVRLHPYYTERILAQSPALARLAAIASHHHERLDGSGYFRGLPAALLTLPARILAAADVYRALTEPRSYRPARPPEEAARELAAEVRAGKLDHEAANAVLAVAGHSTRATQRMWPAGLSDREIEVLRLLARGCTNREMAHQLHVAEKTVGHHVQHIYNKIAVSTRAAATLFALQHDLLA